MPDYRTDWRRALEVLADAPHGSTEALMPAHGITSGVIVGLIDTGLASSTTEPILAGGRPVEVTAYRGLVALERRSREER